MKILVLSDTHGLLRPQVKEALKECDAVIHGGDYAVQRVMDEIKDIVRPDVPLFFVKGNNDGEWASSLPDHLEFVLEGVKFYVVHDKKDLPKDLGDCQVVIFGHSHRYMEERKEGKLYLNPGSCGKRRFQLGITMAVLRLDNEKISVERVDLAQEDVVSKDILPQQEDLPTVIHNIMKKMDKGWKTDRISREIGVEQELVEDICRIRVTHPGVTAEGILNKIEVNQSRH